MGAVSLIIRGEVCWRCDGTSQSRMLPIPVSMWTRPPLPAWTTLAVVWRYRRAQSRRKAYVLKCGLAWSEFQRGGGRRYYLGYFGLEARAFLMAQQPSL